MIELARTRDAVRLSFLRAILDEAGIDHVVLDDHVASLLGSAFGARLMVADAELTRARRLIAAAEEAIGSKSNEANDED